MVAYHATIYEQDNWKRRNTMFELHKYIFMGLWGPTFIIYLLLYINLYLHFRWNPVVMRFPKHDANNWQKPGFFWKDKASVKRFLYGADMQPVLRQFHSEISHKFGGLSYGGTAFCVGVPYVPAYLPALINLAVSSAGVIQSGILIKLKSLFSTTYYNCEYNCPGMQCTGLLVATILTAVTGTAVIYIYK